MSSGYFDTAQLSLLSGTVQNGMWLTQYTFDITKGLAANHRCNSRYNAFQIGGVAFDSQSVDAQEQLAFVNGHYTCLCILVWVYNAKPSNTYFLTSQRLIMFRKSQYNKEI
jgi:hypothetical protein